jgi:hypothetical protein
MDTTKLVVGQELFIFDNSGSKDIGKVIKISPSGNVEISVCDKLFLRFDRNGVGEVGPGQHPSLEYGPWHLDDMPLAERLAYLEKVRQAYQEFVTWWKGATSEQRLMVVNKWYDILDPRARRAPAEDVARIADISSDKFLTGVLKQYWKTQE